MREKEDLSKINKGVDGGKVDDSSNHRQMKEMNWDMDV